MENTTSSKKTIVNWITAHKARFFILSGFLASIIILALDYRNGFDWAGIQVEAHGMLFDVILFGIILSFYEAYMEKKRKKEEKESIHPSNPCHSLSLSGGSKDNL